MKLTDINLKLATAGVLLGGLAGATALTLPQNGHATDVTPVETQVNTNTQELANHEARITNTENDVKDLQNNTGIAPSKSDVTVPTPTPVVSAPKVTVVSYEMIYLDGGKMDCKYTYSDGSAYQWNFSYRDAQGVTHTNGICDIEAVGTIKP